MSRAIALCLCGCLVLGACGSGGHPDLDAWMKEQGKTSKGKLEPLPPLVGSILRGLNGSGRSNAL